MDVIVWDHYQCLGAGLMVVWVFVEVVWCETGL